uniref:Uncharacterized protein n=1 Tax=Leersia perrieri TaxID=77586 RepID=A0A0D9VZV9_9ORYZ
MSLLRRSLYMVSRSSRADIQFMYTLRCIDTSRFFSSPDPPPAPSSGEIVIDRGGTLPPPRVTFSAPASDYSSGQMEIMLLARDKLLAADLSTSRSTIYGDEFGAPPINLPVHIPVHRGDDTGGSDLYLLDMANRFEALVHHKLWFGLSRKSKGNRLCACDLHDGGGGDACDTC